MPGSQSEPASGDVTREMAVGPLLARANLLRMRGQWDEAIAVCTEALLQAPKSPTAHSVLGDIYEAQGKYDDALQWYGMAVDLSPDRSADREKLERVVAVQRNRLRERDTERAVGMDVHRAQMEGKLSTFSPAPASGTGGRAAAERTVEWFDRVFPPGRSESIARLIFALCGIIAVLIASAAIFVYTSSNRTRSNASLVADSGTNPSGLPTLAAPSAPVRVTIPRTASPAPRESSAAKPSPSPSATAAPNASAAQAPTLQSQLSQSLPPSISVAALQGDGGTSSPYHLDIILPKSPQEALPSTQERVLRAAALAARTLALLDNRSFQIMVRASVRDAAFSTDSSVPARGAVNTVIFQGDVAASTIRGTDPAIAPTATLHAQFSNVSWSFPPYSRSSNDGPVSGEPARAVPPAAALAGPAPP